MNFNHLRPPTARQTRCAKGGTTCYFVPAGNVRATAGENIHLTLVCRNCDKREDVFLSKQEYFIQEKLIEKEIKRV